jgi:tetratricopeptide (TPR) repeat protein
VIVLAGVLTYWNGLTVPFLFDDFAGIVRNPQIRDLSNWGQVFSPPSDTGVAGRPLAHLSFAVNYAFGGLDVRGYHLVNIALHVLCGLLIFGLVRRTLDAVRVSESLGVPSVGLACAVALLWIVHPLNTEVVDYLSQRTESMMALCYLLTLYASLRATGAPNPRRWLAAAVVACAAGMACKESMVTAPVMVVVFDRVFVFESLGEAFRQRWRFYSGLAAGWLLLAGLLASHSAISSGGFATAHSTRWNYLLNQAILVTRYLRLAIWPRGLVFYYGWARPLTLGDVWPYALFLALLIAATTAALVRRPRVGFLGVWVFITLAPTSSFAPIAAEVGAERRMYLPLIAIVALVVIGVAALRPRFRTRRADLKVRQDAGSEDPAYVLPLLALVLATAVALSAVTMARTREYASALTIAQTTLARWPTPNAHQLVGQELAAAGQHEEAIRHLREAVAGYPPARYSLGSELFAAGRLGEAIEQLQAFVVEEPSIAPVKSARRMLARAFAARHEMRQAIEQLQLVLAASPSDVAAHGLLADALATEHRFAESVTHYQAFLSAQPGDADAWTGLGVALVATGKGAEAVAAFRNAVGAVPGNGHFRVNLARALLDQGDPAGAGEQAQQAVALDANDPAAHEVLGRVLAAMGKIDDARREFERALQIDPKYVPASEGLRSLRIKTPGPRV